MSWRRGRSHLNQVSALERRRKGNDVEIEVEDAVGRAIGIGSNLERAISDIGALVERDRSELVALARRQARTLVGSQGGGVDVLHPRSRIGRLSKHQR